MTERLQPIDTFRARTWRDVRRTAAVRALSHQAYRLLEGIVLSVLTKQNNGVLTLGPKTFKDNHLGLSARSSQFAAIHELCEAKLLRIMASGKSGQTTFYGLEFLPLMIEPPSLDYLSKSRQVNLSESRQDPPEKLSKSRQELSKTRQVRTRKTDLHLKNARARTRASESSQGENGNVHSSTAVTTVVAGAAGANGHAAAPETDTPTWQESVQGIAP